LIFFLNPKTLRLCGGILTINKSKLPIGIFEEKPFHGLVRKGKKIFLGPPANKEI